MGHILDWREMGARPTISSSSFHGLLELTHGASWSKLRGAWAGGKHIGDVVPEDQNGEEESTHEEEEKEDIDIGEWDLGVDDLRGWLIAFAWILASLVE